MGWAPPQKQILSNLTPRWWSPKRLFNEICFETGAERDFIDPSDSYVEVNVQVVKGGGACIRPNDQLALTNNLFEHGLWEKVTIQSGFAQSEQAAVPLPSVAVDSTTEK